MVFNSYESLDNHNCWYTMKRHLLLLLALAAPIITSCNKSSSSTAQQAIITPGSARAHMLALSHEDIFYLNQQSPMILNKIDRGDRLNIDDIIMMHEVGVSPSSMISIIDYTNTRFELTTSDVIRLQMEGVSFRVINHMIQS